MHARLLSSPLQILVPLVHTPEEASACARVLTHMRGCGSISERGRHVRIPIFTTSSVSGAGLQLLHGFLKELEPHPPPSLAPPPPQQQPQEGSPASEDDAGGDVAVASQAACHTVAVAGGSGGHFECDEGREDPVLFQVRGRGCAPLCAGR